MVKITKSASPAHGKDLMAVDRPRALQMPRSESYGSRGYGFVKIHKENLEMPPFIDIGSCAKAQNPLFKAIIMQFTIIAQKASIVKYFFQKNRIFFVFEKNRQKFRREGRRGGAIPRPCVPPASRIPSRDRFLCKKPCSFTYFFQYFHRNSVYKSPRIWYTNIIHKYVYRFIP